MRLPSSAALDEPGRFADNFSGVEPVVPHHVVAEHHRQQWFVAGGAADDGNEPFAHAFAQFEDQIFRVGRL